MESVAELEAELDLQDLLMLALMQVGHDSLLPEIVKAFGHASTFRFLEIFGGCLIRVPERSALLDAGVHAAVYRRVQAGEEPRDLAVEFGRSTEEVEAIHEKMIDVVRGTAPHLERTFAKKKKR